MLKLYNATAGVKEYCDRFLKNEVPYGVNMHDNCLFDITFFDYPVITPVRNKNELHEVALRISFKNKSMFIGVDEFTTMEIS